MPPICRWNRQMDHAHCFGWKLTLVETDSDRNLEHGRLSVYGPRLWSPNRVTFREFLWLVSHSLWLIERNSIWGSLIVRLARGIAGQDSQMPPPVACGLTICIRQTAQAFHIIMPDKLFVSGICNWSGRFAMRCLAAGISPVSLTNRTYNPAGSRQYLQFGRH